MTNHEMIVQSKYMPVLRCGPCDRAISRGIEETDAQWKLRVTHFQAAHAESEPANLEPSDFRQGTLTLALNYVQHTPSGEILWQEAGEPVAAFVRRAHAWQKER